MLRTKVFDANIKGYIMAMTTTQACSAVVQWRRTNTIHHLIAQMNEMLPHIRLKLI